MLKPGIKADLNKISFSIKEIFEEIAELIKPYADKKNLLFKCETDEETSHLIVEGDPFKLKQVIINLASNAIKFTLNGNMEINATHKRINGKRIELCILVKDTGVGILKNDLEKIFIPFENDDSNVGSHKISSGFGLSMCQRIVKMLGGEISVESESHVGSIFKVTIPYNSIKENLEALEKMPESKTVNSGERNVEVFEEDRMIPAYSVFNKLSSTVSGFTIDNLKKIGNNNEDFVKSMLEKFINTASKNAENMMSGLAGGDFSKLMNAAHKSIASYHMLGLEDLVKHLQYIELHAREGAEVPELSSRVQLVHKETWKVILEIRNCLKAAEDEKRKNVSLIN